jgi:aryl carrier-like protein
MAARLDTELQRRLSRNGIEPLPTDRALRALDQAWGTGRPQLGAFAIDWPLFAARLPAARERWGLVSELLPNVAAQRGALLAPPPPEVLQEIRRAPTNERAPLVLALLADQLARILGHEAAKSIDTQAPLLELGLDSLMAVEVKNWINAHLAVNVPIETLINGAALEQIADSLSAELAVRDIAVSEPQSLPENDAFEVIEL